jgi:hypothetical protein
MTASLRAPRRFAVRCDGLALPVWSRPTDPNGDVRYPFRTTNDSVYESFIPL